MERSLYVTRQGIHPVEHGAVRELELALIDHHLDGPSDKVSLTRTRVGIHDDYLLAL